MTGIRDGVEISALLTDRYLEALLAAADRGALDAPADADLDPGVRTAAAALRRDLLRVSPSFRFEDRLAARLGEVGLALRAPTGDGTPTPTGVPAGDRGAAARPTPLPALGLDPLGPDPDDDPFDRARPILIRGAVASAVVSIVGAAWFAWRRGYGPSGWIGRFQRPGRSPEPVAVPSGPVRGGLA